MLSKACEATFSFVRTMILRIDSNQPCNNGSCCSGLACTKTLLGGQSVLPSNRDNMRDKCRKEIAVLILYKR